ncbi:MAG TPA: D-2-hydroxyacid dehydrogenase [Polyangiaceae bacterium]|nr:D-2-hydroxyacid dehydrogenase [Polyangiaceae bacterium]
MFGSGGEITMKVLCLIELPPSARERITAIRPDIELSELERSSPAFADELGQAEVIAGWLTEDELARARNLRWLQLGSAGADRFVENAAPGVLLTTASGVFGPAMAEHVLAMMLTLARGLDRMASAQRESRWASGLVRGGLIGNTLGIVGLGDIGRAIAVRAKGFEMHVLGVKRLADGPAPPGVDELFSVSALDDVLARSDHVVLVLPKTRQTDRLLDARRLGLMKPGAFVYNIGRGNAIDEPALIEALRSGALAGAGLDVFDREPLAVDSPLWSLPNVIISPHAAGYTPRYRRRFADIFADNLERYVSGQPLRNLVERERGY